VNAANAINQSSDNVMTPEVQNEFVWTIALSAVEIFYGQCQVSAQPQNPSEFKALTTNETGLFSAVNVIGKNIKASLYLAIPDKTFLQIMSKSFGETFTTVSKEIESGAIELVNIVYGAAKEFFSKDGITLERALPYMTKAQDITNKASKSVRTLQVTFTSDAGPFELVVIFEV
jgi:CheY-specific phosphatase CheX